MNITSTTTPSHMARLEFNSTEEALLHTVQVIIGLLMILSVLTNAMVIRIFLGSKFGKLTTAKILYANISISDEFFLLACIFQAIIYGNECNGNCRIVFSYATHISGFVSTYTMAFIAFKRYHVIAFPMENRTNSKWPTFAAIFCIWCFSSVMTLIFVRYVEVVQFNKSFFARICTVISSPVKASHEDPYFSLVAMVAVPLLIGLVFSLMAAISLQNRKIIGDNVTKEAIAIKRRQKYQSIVMIMMVILTFAVCWLPVTIFYTIERLNYSTRLLCDYNYYFYGISAAMLMVEFGANPVIYWFLNPDFRKGLRSEIALCVRCIKRDR
ncbi:prolactin-releasing peptide receptor-like [Bradysia coprophila]|uniref:prolactin-releasing peptide receptor-like n=1 Tax=Bradysia coprophila TaxID=38358 RepID=UPI00187DD8FE|nr:prolactin-releasing peptide receptor-like [Bradysia coprophila]